MMYDGILGQATEGEPPLLLLRGGFPSISTCFGPMLPTLAAPMPEGK